MDEFRYLDIFAARIYSLISLSGSRDPRKERKDVGGEKYSRSGGGDGNAGAQ